MLGEEHAGLARHAGRILRQHGRERAAAAGVDGHVDQGCQQGWGMDQLLAPARAQHLRDFFPAGDRSVRASRRAPPGVGDAEPQHAGRTEQSVGAVRPQQRPECDEFAVGEWLLWHIRGYGCKALRRGHRLRAHV